MMLTEKTLTLTVATYKRDGNLLDWSRKFHDAPEADILVIDDNSPTAPAQWCAPAVEPTSRALPAWIARANWAWVLPRLLREH